MKRKMTCVLLAAIMLSFAACGSSASNAQDDNKSEEMVGMANPWTETDAAGIMEKSGVSFVEPAGATDIKYSCMESQQLAQMVFTLDGEEFTARIKPTAEYEDISGCYYTWEYEEDCKIGWCDGKIMQAKDGDKTVEVCMWFDTVPGIMYSLSTSGTDLNGLDIEAIANEVYEPMQDDVE